MTVFYRMCGIPSKNPSPIYQDNKFELNKLCLRSFSAAFKGMGIKVIFILDHCEPEAQYREMVHNLAPFPKEYIFTKSGINESMLKAYDLAKDCDDDIFLFQECDYLYRPDTGRLLETAIDHLGLVSPYDHVNFYIDRNIHGEYAKLHLVNNFHFRTTERNTMTFGVKAHIFKENFDTFYKYGYLDNDVWHEMRAKTYPLWVPIPSIATHMVQDYLAPGVNWQDEWEKYQ